MKFNPYQWMEEILHRVSLVVSPCFSDFLPVFADSYTSQGVRDFRTINTSCALQQTNIESTSPVGVLLEPLAETASDKHGSEHLMPSQVLLS